MFKETLRACLITSAGLARHRYLPALLDGASLLRPTLLPWRRQAATAVLAWGCKPSALRAENLASARGLPLLRLEDGFIRSVEPGGCSGLSLVIDDVGIYYDATRPSRLERLIAQPLDFEQQQRSRRVIAAWRQQRVSKYNHAPDCAELPDEPFVLLIDQTRGDASIRCGLADAGSFKRMLAAALAENPQLPVYVKTHPDVHSGRKRGHFSGAELAAHGRVRLLADDVHPVSLICAAEVVYTVSSQTGFEALLWGKRVRTFGMPFYAGWGLTEDELPAPQRRTPATLEQLTHAALIGYARYIDPETGRRCEVERLIEWMGLQRTLRHRFARHLYALGFSRWKKPIVRAFVQGSEVHFIRRYQQLPPGAPLLVWGRRAVEGSRHGCCIRVEDGFLRSVGLGAALIRPLSWVLDEVGIYYDASVPSRLENILLALELDPSRLQRARALREQLLRSGLTKYNVDAARWTRPPGGRRIILVPGQVEGDMSIRYGAATVRSNLELLQAVRQAHPDAHVLYKPHPDVVAGLRRAGQQEHETRLWCDEVLHGVAMGPLLAEVDEVHVLTSLSGFEALLRGKRVVCYGIPFYAGWGLTQDIAAESGHAAFARRRRRLSLDELLAGVLLEYPSYVSRVSGAYTSAEQAIHELLQWQNGAVRPSRLRQHLLRWFSRLRP